MKEQIKNYDTDIQRLYLQMLLHDAETFVRVQSIFDPESFDRSLRPTAEFINLHVNEYKVLPTLEQVQATTSIKFDRIDGITPAHLDWLMDEFETFARHKALERAIIASADMLEKGHYGDVENKIKAAVQIGLTKDIGTNYFEDPRGRLTGLRDGNGQISSGWTEIDHALYGGLNRGELTIWAGGSGSGKSLLMQNLSLNWVLAGLNGIYFTLELSEALCSMRLDSMVAEVSSRDVFKRIDDVELKVRMTGKKSGALQIKYMPSGSSCNDFRSYIKEYTTRTGHKPDFVAIDYLDLCSPNNKSVDPGNLFVKDKYVSEEMRNLAKELNAICITGSQLNRAAVEEVEFDHSHIAGGMSKINTADNVIGIFTSRAMRERGLYQVQFMKTRSSNGVGRKVELEFDTETLRIKNSSNNNSQTASATLYQNIKTRSTVTADPGTTFNTGSDSPGAAWDEPVGKITATTSSSRLKQMLGNLNQ